VLYHSSVHTASLAPNLVVREKGLHMIEPCADRPTPMTLDADKV
jgi:hypothetical protein